MNYIKRSKHGREVLDRRQIENAMETNAYTIFAVIAALICAASDQTAVLIVGLAIIAPVPVMQFWRLYNNERGRS
jgi:hypothetical protein